MAKEKINFEDEQVRLCYRHTTSHILAQAVKKLWPDAKLAIGPAIDNGFYYDFDMEHKLNDQDLLKIQKEMKKVIQANYPLERFELPREEAIKFMADKHEDYKVELIEDLPEDEVISFYQQGDFVDLCAGPHMASTGQIKAVQAAERSGCLLERRCEAQDAPENLWNVLPDAGGAGRVPAASGRSQEERPPEDRQGNGSVRPV